MVVFGILLFMALSGCASPVTVKSGDDPKPTPAPSGHVIYVKNSLWQDVPIQTVAKSVGRSISRAVSDSELLDAVTSYNAQTMDDFLRVYYDEAPDLADAPPVNVFVVNPDTYAVLSEADGIPRQSLVDDIANWRQASYGRLLFIDHVPPAPVVTPPPSLYAYYAIYEVDNNTGAILLEDHCGYLPDDTFVGEWITTPEGQTAPDGTPGGGWASVDAYYLTTLHAYQSEAVPTANHLHVVTRQLYTPPTP